MHRPEHDELPADVRQALQSGRKIEAIRRLRNAHGTSLKESRDLIELWIDGHPVLIERSDDDGRGNSSAGSILVAILVAVLLVGMAGWFMVRH